MILALFTSFAYALPVGGVCECVADEQRDSDGNYEYTCELECECASNYGPPNTGCEMRRPFNPNNPCMPTGSLECVCEPTCDWESAPECAESISDGCSGSCTRDSDEASCSDGDGRCLNGVCRTFGTLAYAPTITSAWKDSNSNNNLEASEYQKVQEVVSIDVYGNVEQTKDARGNSQYTRFDSVVNAFPVKGWNDGMGNENVPAWQIVYRPDWVPIETVDANQQKTRITYDQYNRPVEVYSPKDLNSQPTVTYEYAFWSSAKEPNLVITKTKLDDSKKMVMSSHFDGVGRSHQSEVQADSSSDIVFLNTYNSRGLEEKSYKPIRRGGVINKNFITANAVAETRQKFMSVSEKSSLVGSEKFIKKEYYADPLGRIKKVISYDPSSFSTMEYVNANGNKIVVARDANGHYTRSTYDAFDNLIKMEENSADDTSYLYTTTYEYDLLGQLLKVTGPRGLVSTNTYNSLGQLVSSTEPDRGTTTFSYDKNGNLVTKTDAKGITIKYEYDKLNRLTKTDYPNSVDTVQGYDVCLNGKGKLCRVSDASGIMEFEYDANGNVIKEVKKINAFGVGKTFTMLYEYDSAGNVLSQQIYGRPAISYAYNIMGQLASVSRDNVLLASFTYTDTGALKDMLYKYNGRAVATMSYTYNLNEWLEAIDARAGADAVFQRTYKYDPVGNLKKKFDDISSTKLLADYGYDPMDRLKEVIGMDYYGKDISFTYDAAGNRLTRNAYNYSYGSSNNRLVEDSAFSYTYDVNGNMQTRTNKQTSEITTYFYDAENRLVRIELPSGIVNAFAYDMNGLRAVKKDSRGTTLYVYDMGGNVIYEKTI